jgi:hypothetical protein
MSWPTMESSSLLSEPSNHLSYYMHTDNMKPNQIKYSHEVKSEVDINVNNKKCRQ